MNTELINALEKHDKKTLAMYISYLCLSGDDATNEVIESLNLIKLKIDELNGAGK